MFQAACQPDQRFRDHGAEGVLPAAGLCLHAQKCPVTEVRLTLRRTGDQAAAEAH